MNGSGKFAPRSNKRHRTTNLRPEERVRNFRGGVAGEASLVLLLKQKKNFDLTLDWVCSPSLSVQSISFSSFVSRFFREREDKATEKKGSKRETNLPEQPRHGKATLVARAHATHVFRPLFSSSSSSSERPRRGGDDDDASATSNEEEEERKERKNRSRGG